MKLSPFALLVSGLVLLATSLHAQTWQSVSSGTPAGVVPTGIGAGSGNTLFAGFGGSGTYRTTDNGATWTKASSGLESLAGDPNSATVTARGYWKTGNRILHGNPVASWRNTAAPPIFYSDNNGATWNTGTATGQATYTLIGFRDFAQVGNYFFAADELSGIVWRSTDNGATWESCRNGVPNNLGGFLSEGVGHAVTTAGTRVLLVTKVWGVYASDDLGNTWYEANNGIPLQPFSVFPLRAGYDIVTATNGTVFASVDGQVYRSTNQGTSWSSVTDGLPLSSVRRLAVSGDKLYGNTLNSFFEIDINTLSVRQLPFTGMDTISYDAFEAHNGYLYCGGTSSLKRLNLATAVRTNFAPAIYQQPVGATKLAGQSHTFTVKASGTLPLTYKWKKGSEYIPSATSATYTIDPLDASHAGSYTVEVTGPGGMTPSIAVTLNVQTITPGTLDSTFAPNSNDTGVGAVNGTSAAVYDIEALANGEVWIGGQWDRIRPNSGSNGDAVKMNASQSVVFDIGSSSVGVEDLQFDSQGRMMVAGILSYPATGAYTTNVVRINTDNTVDSTFKVHFPSGNGQRVRVIKEYPGNRYVIGGDFTTVNGVTRNRLAILNSDGSLDSLNPYNGISLTSVFDIEVLEDGSMLVSGSGVFIGNSYRFLVKITAAGVIDTNWNTPINTFNNGYALHVQPDGKILVGGDFTGRLARLNADGSVDTTFNKGGSGISGSQIYDIRQQPDGKILVVGTFSSYNGVAKPDFIRLLPNGQLDTNADFARPAVIGGSQHARSVSASPDGQYVYVGFDVGAASQNVLVRYLNAFDDPVISSQPTTVSVDKNGNATLKVIVYSSSGVTYQWFKNGAPLSGQNSATLTLTGVQENDSAFYTVQATTQGQTLTSQPAELRVLAAPVIASSPASLTQLAGKPLSLTVDAYGQTNNIGYKWYKDGVALWGGADFSRTIVGTNTLTYSNSVLRIGDGGTYRLIVTNLLGRATTDVQVAVLPQAAHLAATYVGPGSGSISRFNNSFIGDDGIIVSGTNIYMFGVYGYGGQERYGLGRTDYDLNLKDTSFNPPFDYSTYQQPQGGIVQSDGKLVIYGSWTSLSNYSRILRLNTDGSVDTSFKMTGFPDQNIGFMVALPDDKFAVYGNAITKIGNHSTSKIAVYNADGSPDTSFKVNSATLGQINDMAVLPDGKILIANSGSCSINGVSVGYLFRLNADGSLDTTFNHSTLNGTVHDFDFMPDGRIVVGGLFTTVGGVSRTGLARLLADGTRDTTFGLTNVVGTGSYIASALAVDDEGGIVVGNGIITVDGVQKGYGFRVKPDGSFDPDYLPENIYAYVVGNLKSLPDGRILMGAAANGLLGSYNGKTITGLAVLHGYPTKLGIIENPLTQFVPVNGSTTLRVGVSGTAVWTYQWYKDGLTIQGATGPTLPLSNVQPGDAGKYTVKVQNVFRTIYSSPAKVTVLAAPIFIKQPVSVSARLGQTVVFQAEAVGLGNLTFQWQKDGVNIDGETGQSLTLNNITGASSGIYRVLAFNSLATAPDNGVPSQGAALSVGAALAGTVDTTFAPSSGMQRSGTVLGIVEAVLWDSNNQPVVGGFFDTINGVTRPNLARFNNDGSTDTGFASAGGPNNYVFDIIKTATGQLYIGGSFGTYASVTQNRVARLNADGSRDSNFASTTAPGNNVYRIVEGTDGKLFAGHNGGSPCVWKYNNTGTRDTGTFTFSASYNSVYAISLYGNNQMLVDGGSGNYHYSYRYGTNGTFDNTWTAATSFPFNSSSYIYDIGVLPDGRALVGGTFVNPDTIQGLTNLVVLGTNGRIVANTSSNLVTDGIVYDIYVYPNGKVLIGGSFTNVNHVKRPGIARLNADLSVDTTFDPGQGIQVAGGGASVNSIDVRNDGKILVGGYFDTFDGAARNGVVVLNSDPIVQPLNIIGAPQAQVVTAGQNANFNVAVSGGTTLNFQWYKGTEVIPNATNSFLTITNAQFDAAANYKVTVTSGNDSVTSTPVSLTVTAPTSITFGDWRESYGLTGEQADPEVDADGDGLPNVVEYVLGTNPTQANQGPTAQPVNSGGIFYPSVTIRRLKAASGFDIIVQASQSLDFNPLVPTTVESVTDVGNGMEDVVVRVNDPLININKVFFNISIAPSAP